MQQQSISLLAHTTSSSSTQLKSRLMQWFYFNATSRCCVNIQYTFIFNIEVQGSACHMFHFECNKMDLALTSFCCRLLCEGVHSTFFTASPCLLKWSRSTFQCSRQFCIFLSSKQWHSKRIKGPFYPTKRFSWTLYTLISKQSSSFVKFCLT